MARLKRRSAAERLDAPARPHRVVMLGFPDAQVLDITGPLEVFARSTRWLRDHAGMSTPPYALELVTRDGGLLRTSGGLELVSAAANSVRAADTLLIAGGIGYAAAARDADLLEWIRKRSATATRVGSICTGAFLLAAAGLLEGCDATTHWAYLADLRRAAPAARVENNAIYVRSGRIYTSAGVTSGMDMALEMVEHDFGRPVALAVAQELVMYVKRPGGQAQFSRQLEAQRSSERFGELQLWMCEHMQADLSVEALAQRAALSVRHFSRLFHEAFDRSPAQYVLELRVDAARQRLESGDTQLKRVARLTGLGDEQNLRRAFRRVLRITPQEYRERFCRA
jgi:transcriptional regulator GlxA family with amidase domain